MSTSPRLPDTFSRLAWSNLAAQSAEQIALAAAPIVAVLTLGVAEGESGLLQTASPFHSCCSRFRPACSPTAFRDAS
jgi:hypothetical protein